MLIATMSYFPLSFLSKRVFSYDSFPALEVVCLSCIKAESEGVEVELVGTMATVFPQPYPSVLVVSVV